MLVLAQASSVHGLLYCPLLAIMKIVGASYYLLKVINFLHSAIKVFSTNCGSPYSEDRRSAELFNFSVSETYFYNEHLFGQSFQWLLVYFKILSLFQTGLKGIAFTFGDLLLQILSLEGMKSFFFKSNNHFFEIFCEKRTCWLANSFPKFVLSYGHQIFSNDHFKLLFKLQLS